MDYIIEEKSIRNNDLANPIFLNIYIPLTELVPVLAQILSIRLIIKDKNSMQNNSVRYQQNDAYLTPSSRPGGMGYQTSDDCVTETTTFLREENFVLISSLISNRSIYEHRTSQRSSKDFQYSLPSKCSDNQKLAIPSTHETSKIFAKHE